MLPVEQEPSQGMEDEEKSGIGEEARREERRDSGDNCHHAAYRRRGWWRCRLRLAH